MIFQIIKSDKEVDKFIQDNFNWVTPVVKDIHSMKYLDFINLFIQNTMKLNSICLHKSLIDFYLDYLNDNLNKEQLEIFNSIKSLIRKIKQSTTYILNTKNLSENEKNIFYKICKEFEIKFISLDISNEDSINEFKIKYKGYLKDR